MTHKEKADQLINNFDGYVHYAIYAVDLLLEELDELLHDREMESVSVYHSWVYWNEVKKQLEEI
jgi:hypothetical protein